LAGNSPIDSGTDFAHDANGRAQNEWKIGANVSRGKFDVDHCLAAGLGPYHIPLEQLQRCRTIYAFLDTIGSYHHYSAEDSFEERAHDMLLDGLVV
jgi:hypothetical protein